MERVRNWMDETKIGFVKRPLLIGDLEMAERLKLYWTMCKRNTVTFRAHKTCHYIKLGAPHYILQR